MTIFEVALLLGCLVAGLINRFDPRVMLWVWIGIASYVVTSIYYSAGWPYHSFATAMADASVCVCLYFFAKYRWEMWLFRVFQLSVAVSILELIGFVPGAYAYALLLEACNWLGLLVIITKGTVEILDNENATDWPISRGLHGALLFVHQERKPHHFFHKAQR